MYGNRIEDYKNPESKWWDCLTESGEIQVGWEVTCEAPGFDPNGDMTEEEYYSKYGEPCIVEIDVPKAEAFYSRINEFRSLVKSDLLDYDFDVMEECMHLAVKTHDVNYLYQIYYMLHDMDYFLLIERSRYNFWDYFALKIMKTGNKLLSLVKPKNLL